MSIALDWLLVVSIIWIESFVTAAFFAPTTMKRNTDDNRFAHHSDRAAAKNSKLQGPLVQPARPNDCTYWVVPDKLIAGEYPAEYSSGETREKLGRYLDCGIDFFLDLTHEGEKQDYSKIAKQQAKSKGMSIDYVRLPIRDFGIPTKSEMMLILNTIDKAISDKKTVYVHCRGGIGRTGTTVGCYLVRHGNTGEEALREVNRLFQTSDRSEESYCSPETKDQMDFVRQWSED